MGQLIKTKSTKEQDLTTKNRQRIEITNSKSNIKNYSWFCVPFFRTPPAGSKQKHKRTKSENRQSNKTKAFFVVCSVHRTEKIPLSQKVQKADSGQQTTYRNNQFKIQHSTFKIASWPPQILLPRHPRLKTTITNAFRISQIMQLNVIKHYALNKVIWFLVKK